MHSFRIHMVYNKLLYIYLSHFEVYFYMPQFKSKISLKMGEKTTFNILYYTCIITYRHDIKFPISNYNV